MVHTMEWKVYLKVEELHMGTQDCPAVHIETIAEELSAPKETISECFTALHILDLITFYDVHKEWVVPASSVSRLPVVA